MIQVQPSRQAWVPYIPAVPAGLSVLAAGAAFQRVFTCGDVAGPVTVAALLGAVAGVAGRQAAAVGVRRERAADSEPSVLDERAAFALRAEAEVLERD